MEKPIFVANSIEIHICCSTKGQSNVFSIVQKPLNESYTQISCLCLWHNEVKKQPKEM